MVFSSIAFIMYFMPVFFLVYYILPASYKNAWLFLASLGFYYYGVRGNPGYLLLMIMSVVVNFWKTDCGTEDEAGEESLACGWNRL